MANGESINRPTALDDIFPRRRLQNEWWAAFLFYMILMMGCFSVLAFAWQPAGASKWLLPAAAVNAYVLRLLWASLNKNYHPVTKTPLPRLGYATWLTILRAGLIGTLAGFAFQTALQNTERSSWLAWTPGAVYISAAILDYFDGYVARITRHETRLGEWLDTKIDALGLLVASILAIGFGRLPVIYIAVGLAYYLFQFGVWYRKKIGRPVIKLEPHPAKRMIAGFQMGLVGLALLPVFSRPVMTIAALIFMLPLLAGFFRDWLVICGFIEVNHLQQTRWDRPIGFMLTKLLPLLLRFVIGAAGIYFFYKGFTDVYRGQRAVSGAVLYFLSAYHLHDLWIVAGAILMVAFGIITRLAALFISLFLAGTLTTWNSPPGLFSLFSCAVTLILTGSGLISAWCPEEALLFKRQGEVPAKADRKKG